LKLSKERALLIAQKVVEAFVQPVEAVPGSPSFFGADIWSSWIRLDGARSWIVLVTYSAELAVQLAHSMYQDDLGAITTDMVMDATGEITNILAGQYKVLLDPQADLATPVVEENMEYEDLFPGPEPLFEINIASRGNLVKVVVLQNAP